MRRDIMRRVIKLVSIIGCFVMPFSTFAQQNPNDDQNQKPAYNWYFGDEAGISFSSGVATPITDGELTSFEGCASISDDQGNLLFYSNGGNLPYPGQVWNRQHNMMPNGNLSGAGGCNSSFQSSLIIQHPKHDHLYYLFTTDCIENGSVGGLRYNIVDMNLDNGLGDVAVKGQLLTTPVNESLTAIRHENKEDWWVIAHQLNTDTFMAYHVTDLGITGLVKSAVGPVTPTYAGGMKASIDGARLAYSGLQWTSLFNFDNRTGVFSNHVDLNFPSYSCTFSSNCRLLYLATGVNKTIYQFDVMENDIGASGVHVGTTSSIGVGNMQLGPDNKIYIARFITSPYLGVIHNPDYRGADCNYVDDGFHLDGKSSKAGLPNYGNAHVGECERLPSENYSNYNGIQFWANHVDATHIGLSWIPQESVSDHIIYVRAKGDIEWQVYSTQGGSISIEGLTPETEYEFAMEHVFNGQNYTHLDHYTSTDLSTGISEFDGTEIGLTATTLNELDYNLYPNPATSTSTLSMNLGSVVQDVIVEVLDYQGRVVDGHIFKSVSGYKTFNIDVSGYANGIYHVSIQSGQRHAIEKLAVIRK